jgi:hypothetical protein
MNDDFSYLTNGSMITLLIILGNLVFFLALPIVVAYYMKSRFSNNKTIEQTVS